MDKSMKKIRNFSVKQEYILWNKNCTMEKNPLGKNFFNFCRTFKEFLPMKNFLEMFFINKMSLNLLFKIQKEK